MANITFGFIGAGNMGGALAGAAAKAIGGGSILVADHSREKAEQLCSQIGARVASNEEIASTCSYIFLGVKPQMMAEMLGSIAPLLKARNDRFILVSMAAGLTMDSICEMALCDAPIIRIMPNTPVSVGCGMILYTFENGVTEEEIAVFTNALACAGKLDKLDEKLIDAGCAVSGCGPAFVDLFIEALADGAVECGLPRDKALLYAAQMVCGSAKLVLDSGKHPGALKDAVCSPGGSTIVGVHALEDCGFRSAAVNAVVAAYEKTVELGKK